jgi:hypothetical protein
MAVVKYIPAWEKIAVEAAAKGFSDIECAQQSGVSMEKLKSNLYFNPEFAEKFKSAKATAPKNLKW